MQRLGVGACVSACSLLATTALGTWSIVLVDSRTGEVAIASATCLENFDLQANSPVVVVGKGAAAAQSTVDVGGANRTRIQAALQNGTDPTVLLAQLAVADGQHQSRQYGVLDTQSRGFTFTGEDCNGWAGGVSGSFTYMHAGQTFEITYAIQGNLLTGEPVVLAALDAVMNTAGDLPERMMAGMEAAAVTGGDARCSCTGTPPCPPPSFAKSADCAYYIVSRPGDSDVSSITIPSQVTGIGQPVVAHLDAPVNGQSFADLLLPIVTTTGTPTQFLVYRNALSMPGATASFLPPVAYPCVVSPTSAACKDVSGDGVADIFVGGGSTAANAPGGITYYRSTLGGGFTFIGEIASPRRVLSVAVGNIDGQLGEDLVFCTATQVFVTLNLGNGSGFAAPTAILTALSVNNISIADVTGDGLQDVIIGAGANSVRFLPGVGNGTFGAQVTLALPAAARATVAVDVDNDGDLDFGVLGSSTTHSLMVRMNNGGGVYGAASTINSSSIGSWLSAVDCDGDGRVDFAYMDGQSRIITVLQTGPGVFAASPRVALATPLGGLTVADVTGDGLPEAMYNTGSLRVLMNNRGTFSQPTGFASGAYYMNINIANQPRAAADPVIQMRAAYDVLRAGLANRVDAVMSRVTVAPQIKRTQVTPLDIELRTYNGQAATGSLASLTLTRVGPGPHATEGATFTSLGGGRYRVMLRGVRAGTDVFSISLREGGAASRVVTLTPRTSITVVGAPEAGLPRPE